MELESLKIVFPHPYLVFYLKLHFKYLKKGMKAIERFLLYLLPGDLKKTRLILGAIIPV